MIGTLRLAQCGINSAISQTSSAGSKDRTWGPKTGPNQSSGLAGPTVQRAAPPKRRLPGYGDDCRSFEADTRSSSSLIRGPFASLFIIRSRVNFTKVPRHLSSKLVNCGGT